MRVTLEKSRVREICMPGSVRAKPNGLATRPSPMTVAELVALLLTKPQDLPVAYSLCSEQCLLSVDMRCIVGLVGDGEPYVALCAGGRERVVRHSLWFR